MLETNEPQQFWTRKILRWEAARYSPWLLAYPPSWPVRARLNKALHTICARAPADWSLLELGCGSGFLAERLRDRYRRYSGIDIAPNAIVAAQQRVPEFKFAVEDVLKVDLEFADLTVFLGLTDWIGADGLARLLPRIKSERILFSFTQASTWNPYRFYRLVMDRPQRHMQALSFFEHEIRATLRAQNFTCEILSPSTLLNPGVLVWAERH